MSPTTEEVVGRVPEAQVADVDRAVAAAREAFEHGPWPRLIPAERGAVLTKVADAIRNDMQGISELISNEMGSPISWGTLAQVFMPTMILDYYVGLSSTFAFDTVKDGLMGPVLVSKEPVGVVAAITPWNVPLFLACARLAPALCRGAPWCSSRPRRLRWTPTCWPSTSPGRSSRWRAQRGARRA